MNEYPARSVACVLIRLALSMIPSQLGFRAVHSTCVNTLVALQSAGISLPHNFPVKYTKFKNKKIPGPILRGALMPAPPNDGEDTAQRSGCTNLKKKKAETFEICTNHIN